MAQTLRRRMVDRQLKTKRWAQGRNVSWMKYPQKTTEEDLNWWLILSLYISVMNNYK